MEVLTNIWNWVLPIGGGLTIGALFLMIGIPALKGIFTRSISKLGIDNFVKKVEETQHEASDKAVDRIKEISFKQTIQPLVESELVKITETANEYIRDEVDGLKDGQQKIVNVLECLATFFDDSIVPDAKKQALRAAIEEAKEAPTEQNISVNVSEIAKSAESPAEKPTKKSGVTR